MKKWFLLVVVLLGAFALYHSNQFQAFFLYDQFYEKIYSTPFDITKEGESVVLPIQFEYETVYKLVATVPEAGVFDSLIREDGTLHYRFISGEYVLQEGETLRPERRNRIDTDDSSSLELLRFSLPIHGASGDLALQLKVVTPFKFLNTYSDSITCSIYPAYHK